MGGFLYFAKATLFKCDYEADFDDNFPCTLFVSFRLHGIGFVFAFLKNFKSYSPVKKWSAPIRV
ncbi:MAG: hypothetical protein CVT49_06795 [candidate division Zixibacteria bacterium HGW-Zixibacteria-1]|nr:MAG: hypothetical protein CVT49_06795 [candidate division Zixibacteria bacterium HGW-Zixibacteria-1]